jgi:hypothetical protein
MKWTLSIVILLLFAGCESAINITPPIILTENSTPATLDSVVIKVEEYADIDGVRINADYYDWFIENSESETIKDDFPDSSVINWVPQEVGYFIIKVKIGYEGNKSITAIKEITITESTVNLQKKVIGHWKGKGVRGYDHGEWGIELVIEDNNHYYGLATYYGFDPYCEKGVFNTGRLTFYHGPVNHEGSYQDSCGIPGNMPFQKIIITGIEENKGIGKIAIGSVSIWTDYIDTSYFEMPFNNLIVDNEKLHFEFPDNNYSATTIDLVKQ